MDENKQKLKEYRAALELCDNQYKFILEKSLELEKEPIIQKYKKMQLDLLTLRENHKILETEYNKLYQSNCEHPLWYCVKYDSTIFEEKQRLICKCIRCGITKTSHSKNFKNKIIMESENMEFGEIFLSNYNIMRKEYLDLESSTIDKEDIAKIMIKKYNNQK